MKSDVKRIIWGPMRRWMEFGNSGGILGGDWSLNSNRQKSGPRPQGTGPFDAIFVSMNYKEQIFELLSAYSSTSYPGRAISSLILNQGDPGTPADDCNAEHIPPGWTMSQQPGNPLFMAPSVWLFSPPIFSKDGLFTGGFAPGLFSSFTFEPPSENG